jgi:excisionase family DNA binding protein
MVMIDTEQPTTWPEFLTVPEVADILRVSKMTVYRMIHAGTLEAIRVGRGFRIRADSVAQIARFGTPAAA